MVDLGQEAVADAVAPPDTVIAQDAKVFDPFACTWTYVGIKTFMCPPRVNEPPQARTGTIIERRGTGQMAGRLFLTWDVGCDLWFLETSTNKAQLVTKKYCGNVEYWTAIFEVDGDAAKWLLTGFQDVDGKQPFCPFTFEGTATCTVRR